jgi:hypothetical protein
MKIHLLLASVLLVFYFGCKKEDKTIQIIGNWRGVSWKSGGVETGRTDANLFFHFKAGNAYQTSYDGQKEEGTFRMDGMKLYTNSVTPEKIEKVVMFSKITPDTLVMEMNRAGQPEQLTLVRMK